ncbi:MAG: YhjD/YihY/BrkB family envelope integrity protein [Planctomycetota bacterium]
MTTQETKDESAPRVDEAGHDAGDPAGPDARPGRRQRARSFVKRDVPSFFTRELWARELSTLPTFRRIAYGLARVAQLTVVNFVKDRCGWRASALTYTTVLSLVPLLALAFSVAKGLGAYDTLRTQTIDPFLESTFGGEAAAEPPGTVPTSDGPTTDGPTIDGSSTDGPSTGGPDPVGVPGGDASVPAPDGTSDAPSPAEGSSEESADGDADTAAPEEASAVAAAESTGDATADTEPTGGQQVRRAMEMVLEFVERTDVSRLGVFGFLIVLFTVVKLLGSIEASFNDIWGVRRARSIPRKIADYSSTIVLVPLLLVTGTGVIGLLRSERFGDVLGLERESEVLALLSANVVVWLAFAFAYVIMPNTRTRLTSALIGGIVGGTMWQVFQWAHVKLQVGVANYNAIYSTFAALPIFLFWVQSSWMTVLLGAEAAAAHQNQARHGQLVRSREYDLAQKEVVALRMVARLTRAFLGAGGPVRVEELSAELGAPERVLEEIAGSLEGAAIVATVELDGEESGLLLARDPGSVRLGEVLEALKGTSHSGTALPERPERDPLDGAVTQAFERFREERDRSEANRTLDELFQS